MPRGNIDIVQEAHEAWGRRDGAALRELLHEQAEFRLAIVGGVEGGIYRVIEFRDGKAVRARFALNEPAPRATQVETTDAA